MIIENYEQLKPFRNKSGVYLFTNRAEPDRHYGGKSVNLYERIAENHKNATGNHYIDYVIKKHGLLEYFEIELVHWWETPVDKWEILALETAVIDEYKCLKEFGGYNLCFFSNDRTGLKHSQETKDKISLARKGKCCGKENHNFGKHLSKEHKLKLSLTHKGKPSPNLGKSPYQASRSKM